MDIRFLIFFSLFCFIQSKVIDLSCGQIRTFVDGHNSRRLKLAKGEISGQPAASEMKFMLWDEELAAKAAKWASHNKFEHNPDRTIASHRFGTGENLFWTASNNQNYEVDLNSALDSWFNEHNYYKYGTLEMSDFGKDKKAIGHYTQMAWSDSIYLGCGISENYENGNKAFYVVCNYGPSGNYIGQTPYKSAEHGSGELTCGIDNCNEPYGRYCDSN